MEVREGDVDRLDANARDGLLVRPDSLSTPRGIGYVVNTTALVVAPGLFAWMNPAILLPIFLAELSLALWLLVKGIAVEAEGVS